MGLRIMLLACKRVLVAIGAMWLISVPHMRPQMTSAQFQQIQRQQQESVQNEWTTSHWDLGQNIRLDAIDSHINATDARVESLRDKHDTLAREVSEGNGEAHVWFGILGAGLLGALTFSFSNFLKITKEKS